MATTLPWIEKYRPKTLDDVIAQPEIIQTLRTLIQKRCLPHLLLYGNSGCGKTSTILACARELYGESYQYMVMKLNASDERGIEVVRNTIKQFVTTKSAFFKEVDEKNSMFKLVILDETDAMTDDAQAILRKVIEEHTANTRFCLICNYIQNINPALQSRCTRFRFAPIDKNGVEHMIQYVADKEGLKVQKSGIVTIYKRASGDMRKVLNILQSTSMVYDIINEKNINSCMGYPQKVQMDTIINSLINDSFEKCYNVIYEIKTMNGLSLIDLIQEIHDMILEYVTTGECDNPSFNKIQIKDVIKILDKMRYVEYNQSVSATENIQLAALIGIFKG